MDDQESTQTTFIDRLILEDKLLLIGWSLLIIWIGGFIFHHAAAKRMVSKKNVILGRDFITFYFAGIIIKENNGQRIYEEKLQKRVQDSIVAPEKVKGVAYYINPASVAVLYSPLTNLPYLYAFFLHTILMFLFSLIAIQILKPNLPGLASQWTAVLLISITWFPMMHSILGGQNAALCMLLLAIAYKATVNEQQMLAGVALGFLFFKPQYTLPPLGLLLLRKKFITFLSAVLVGMGHYLLGAAFCGWNWPSKMVASISGFYGAWERVASGATHISIKEVIDFSIIQPLQRHGDAQVIVQFFKIFTYLLILSGIFYLIWIWQKADVRNRDFGLYWAIVSSVTLLISLHTQYYDTALLIIPLILIINHQVITNKQIPGMHKLIMALVYILSPFIYLFEVGKIMGFQPLVLLPLWVTLWAATIIHKKNPSQERP
ncbi:glycosyltransferase family 87 protein [Candidatus Riflebacteria bacterium]